jgi:two-component system sensor histidine kinase BaeS
VSLRVRLAAAMALVALLTAIAVAIAAPAIVGRGFAAALSGETGPGQGTGTGRGGGMGPGAGAGQGPGGGVHWQQVQQETVITLIAVAGAAAVLASLVGFVVATRTVRPLRRLEQSAAAVARGDLDARSGLAGRTDEIGSLARSFDGMAADLAATEVARRRFFADAAHELKTPLAVIDATTSAVIDGVYEHDDRHLETIRDQARLLSRIVDDLRTVSLAEVGALPLRIEAVPLGPVISAVARDLGTRATPGGPRVESVDPGSLAVRADRDRLRQVLGALGDNALRFAGDGGWLRISAAPAAGASVRISVVDSGPGIAAGDVEHIFDRFYQADPSRDRSTGTSGLGLAIVRAIVDALGGRVTAGNEPGAGARFDVELPAA